MSGNTVCFDVARAESVVYVDWSQEDRIVITRHGKPAAVMLGVEGKDWEDLVLQTSSTFWKPCRGEEKAANALHVIAQIPLAEAKDLDLLIWTF